MGESQLNLCVLDVIIAKFLHKQRIKQMLFYINEQIMPKQNYKNNKLLSIFQILFFCWKNISKLLFQCNMHKTESQIYKKEMKKLLFLQNLF